jgi:anti-anti-sigma factor
MTRQRPRRLNIEGDLTILTAAEHHQRLRSFLADGTNLQVGLSGVRELDTAGLQVLLLARREANQRKAVLTLCDLSQAVNDVLAIVHLGSEFTSTEFTSTEFTSTEFAVAEFTNAEPAVAEFTKDAGPGPDRET